MNLILYIIRNNKDADLSALIFLFFVALVIFLMTFGNEKNNNQGRKPY